MPSSHPARLRRLQVTRDWASQRPKLDSNSICSMPDRRSTVAVTTDFYLIRDQVLLCRCQSQCQIFLCKVNVFQFFSSLFDISIHCKHLAKIIKSEFNGSKSVILQISATNRLVLPDHQLWYRFSRMSKMLAPDLQEGNQTIKQSHCSSQQQHCCKRTSRLSMD